MRTWMPVITILFWGLHLLDFSLYLPAGFLMLGYMLVRFRKAVPVLLFSACLFLGFFQMKPLQKQKEPEAGLYQVVEIRRKQAFVSNGDQMVQIQNLENACFGQIYQIESFEEIHSLHNFGVFYYAGWLQEKGIGWMAWGSSVRLVQESNSLQAKIYRRLQDHPLALMLLYNIKPDPAGTAANPNSSQSETGAQKSSFTQSGAKTKKQGSDSDQNQKEMKEQDSSRDQNQKKTKEQSTDSDQDPMETKERDFRSGKDHLETKEQGSDSDQDQIETKEQSTDSDQDLAKPALQNEDTNQSSSQSDKKDQSNRSSGKSSMYADDRDSWMLSMGLPLIGAFSLLEKRLTRRLDSQKAYWIVTVAALFYGHLFFWSMSLARYLIFRLCRKVKDWPLKWSLQVLVFLLLFPAGASQFTLVLPAFLSLSAHFTKRSSFWIQKFSAIWILAVLQILYFGKLDLISLFGFGLLRKAFGLYSLCGWIVLLMEQLSVDYFGVLRGLCCLWEKKLLDLASLSMMRVCWWGSPGLLVSMVLCILFVCMLYKPKAKVLAGCYLGIVLYMASFSLDPFFHVYQIDVGQGDAALIVEPFRKSVVMIDAAKVQGQDLVSNVYIPFLRSKRIGHIDALILSHEDVDHSGSKDELLQAIEIRQVIENRRDAVPVSYPFYSLLPEREVSEENDESIVSWFSYDNFRYLWTGDASVEVEGQLLQNYDLKADILKAGHHGSMTSSSAAFLKAVNPDLAIISAGWKNRYGHPHPKVMSRLHQQGIDSLQTKENGMIHLFSWRNWLFVSCADGTFSCLFKNAPDSSKDNDLTRPNTQPERFGSKKHE